MDNQLNPAHSNKISWSMAIASISGAIFIGVAVAVSAIPLSAIHSWVLLVWLAAPIGGFVAFWFAKNPDKFIIFVAVFIPFESFVLKWLPSGVQSYARYMVEVLIIAVFLLVLLDYWRKHGLVWYRDILNVPLVVFLAISLLSMIVNDVPVFIYIFSLKNLLRYVFLYYMISFLDLPLSYLKQLTLLMILIAVIQALLGVAEEIIGLPATHFLKPDARSGFTTLAGTQNPFALWGKAKPSGTIGIYGSYGVFLVFWAIFSLVKILLAPMKNKQYILLFIIISAGILVSRARTSWVLLFVGSFLALFYLRRRWLVNIVITSIPIVLMTMLALSSINIFGEEGPQTADWGSIHAALREGSYQTESVIQRLGEILTTEYWSKASRVVTLTVTLPEILKNYPLLGVGPGTMGSPITGGGSSSPGVFPQYSHQDWLNVPENIIMWTADTGFVAMIAQFGVLGILPWGIFLWQLLKSCWRNFKQAENSFIFWFSAGIFINIILFFLSEFVGDYITFRAYGLYFWIWAGFAVNLPRLQTLETNLFEDAQVNNDRL